MKISSYVTSPLGLRVLPSAVGVMIAAALLTGCAGASTPQSEEANSEQSASPDSAALQQVDGRGVSASDTELVLRTADGERTFQIRPDDVQAIDPAHFDSHIGIPTLGFRIYYLTEANIDYAVSAEEIKGSTLGFD